MTGATPAATHLCPECGRADAGVDLAPRNRRPCALLGLLVAVLALTAAVYPTIRGSKTSGVSSGGFFAELLEPPFTLKQVRAIAASGTDGKHAPGALVAALADQRTLYTPMQPGRRSLDVKFAGASGSRSDTVRFGWPHAVLSKRVSPDYTDAIARTGLIPAATDPMRPPMGKYEMPSDLQHIPPRPLWEWQGRALLYQPPPEQTAGIYTTYFFRPGALSVSLALLILLSLLLAAIAYLTRRITGREVFTRPRRYTLLAAVAIVLALLNIFTREHVPGRIYDTAAQQVQVGPPGPIYHVDPELARLEQTKAEVQSLPRSAESDRLIASAILSKANLAGRSESEYLFAGSACETQLDASTSTSGTHAFPLFSLLRAHYIRRPDFGTPEYMLPGRRFGLGWSMGGLSVWTAPSDPQLPIRRLLINTELAGMILVGATLLGFAATIPMRLRQSRRIRRRRRQGRCIYCDYQAFPPTPA